MTHLYGEDDGAEPRADHASDHPVREDGEVRIKRSGAGYAAVSDSTAPPAAAYAPERGPGGCGRCRDPQKDTARSNAAPAGTPRALKATLKGGTSKIAFRAFHGWQYVRSALLTGLPSTFSQSATGRPCFRGIAAFTPQIG